MHPHIHFSIDNLYFALPTFALSAFVGGAIALFYVYSRSLKFQINFMDLLKLLIATVIFGTVGSRLLFLLTQLPHLVGNLSTQTLVHFFTRGGIVFYGGLFGVLFAIKMYTIYKKQYVGKLFQLASPAIPLFHGFARIGCLLGGCCSGRRFDEPFALMGAIYFDRLPIPLFESIFNFILFATLLVVERKNSKIELLRIYLVSYALYRFIIEFFRADLARGIFWIFSTSQWISLIILVYFMLRYFWDASKSIKNNTISY